MRSLTIVVHVQNVVDCWVFALEFVDIAAFELTLCCQMLVPVSCVSPAIQTALKLSSASLLLSPMVVVWLLFSSIISIMWWCSSLRDDFRLSPLLLLLFCRVRTTSKLCARLRVFESIGDACTASIFNWCNGDGFLCEQHKFPFALATVDSLALLFRVIVIEFVALVRLLSLNEKLNRLLNWRNRDMNDFVPLLAAELAVLKILPDEYLLAGCCCWILGFDCWFLCFSSIEQGVIVRLAIESLRISLLEMSVFSLLFSFNVSVTVAGGCIGLV